MTTSEVWLWPEGQENEHLRLWTPDHTQRFAKLAASGPGPVAPVDLRRRMDGSGTQALETALPAPLAEWLATQLRQIPRLRLRLSADLPMPWQRFPYEWLTLDGRPLHDRLQVWRTVPPVVEPIAPVRTARVALLNLWPEDEAVQPLAPWAISPAEVHRYDGRRWIEALLRTQDPRAFSALCLIVHGSECANALPFRLPDKTGWTLPTAQPLPPLVMLLACGNCDGNLLDYAAILLKQGIVTVLAALGKLDARDATVLLPGLLQGWRAGQSIGDALEATQARMVWQGWGRLCLLGAGELRMSDVPRRADEPTHRLIESVRPGDDTALPELLRRLTLHSFFRTGDPSQATPQLRKVLAVKELGAPEENRKLLHQLCPLVENLPILTRLWVMPLLTHLAEQHDHERLNACRQELEALARAHPEFAGLYADWAKAEYRRGYYARAVAATVDGLRSASGTDETSIRLLGSLILVLIDLNLPKPGQRLFDLREQRLDQLSDEFATQERFKSLDHQGRLDLRRGAYRKAWAGFQCKQAEAPEHNETGQRELAWLLYTAALVGPMEGDDRYARECRTLLATCPEPGGGNDDVLYLLRALAAWAWRRQDATALEALLPWRPELEKRLYARQDIGPVGFTLTYLHLYQQPCESSFTLPTWEELQVGLKAGRYFLELAIFSHLLERPLPETDKWLTGYQNERRATLRTLTPENLPAWLQPELPDISPEALSDLESQERQLLLATSPPDWNALVAAHLLPW